MGKIEKGYLGGFSGKVGTAVGSSWKNIDVLRSRPPRKRKGLPSDLQAVQQARFGLMINFLRPLNDLLNLTYNKSAASVMTGLNKALSVNADAITGVFPTFAIDYPKVQLSKGSLPAASAPAAVSTAAGKLVFTWADNSGISNALISDVAFVAAFNEELGHWIYVQKAATRNAGTYTLDVTSFSGKPVQTYIGFMSADRKKVAPSLFTGVVAVL